MWSRMKRKRRSPVKYLLSHNELRTNWKLSFRFEMISSHEPRVRVMLCDYMCIKYKYQQHLEAFSHQGCAPPPSPFFSHEIFK